MPKPENHINQLKSMEWLCWNFVEIVCESVVTVAVSVSLSLSVFISVSVSVSHLCPWACPWGAGSRAEHTSASVCVCYKHRRLFFAAGGLLQRGWKKRPSTEKKRRSPLLFYTYYHIYPSLFFYIEKHVSAILYKNEIRVKVFFFFFAVWRVQGSFLSLKWAIVIAIAIRHSD
jgi:hypothetical protein